ncbi:unnamed protein product [Zymoseptoria tritici ST99CH_3D7]|uniref:Uncharacterized protein n=1 Tax=Zymoseptoria tritici (strain ST99CH_3D7) TaxID=1276538 RepID=A0A1X7RLE3_ZYMT9|nr:unnamed protein product [Zymoseptoria tritici ST99CH_3D7]
MGSARSSSPSRRSQLSACYSEFTFIPDTGGTNFFRIAQGILPDFTANAHQRHASTPQNIVLQTHEDVRTLAKASFVTPTILEEEDANLESEDITPLATPRRPNGTAVPFAAAGKLTTKKDRTNELYKYETYHHLWVRHANIKFQVDVDDVEYTILESSELYKGPSINRSRWKRGSSGERFRHSRSNTSCPKAR